MKSYLSYYSEVWNLLTKEHEHQVGEDTSGCENCALERFVKEFTEFERFCHDWFFSYINQFTLEANLIEGLMREIKFREKEKTLFLKAMNMLYQTQLYIQNEQMKKEMEKTKHG